MFDIKGLRVNLGLLEVYSCTTEQIRLNTYFCVSLMETKTEGCNNINGFWSILKTNWSLWIICLDIQLHIRKKRNWTEVVNETLKDHTVAEGSREI